MRTAFELERNDVADALPINFVTVSRMHRSAADSSIVAGCGKDSLAVFLLPCADLLPVIRSKLELFSMSNSTVHRG